MLQANASKKREKSTEKEQLLFAPNPSGKLVFAVYSSLRGSFNPRLFIIVLAETSSS